MVAVPTRVDHDVEHLRELLSRHALKRAPVGQPFVLASGKESSVYFDVKNVTLAPEAFEAVGRLFWEQAREYDATAVGGLSAGSIPISMAVIGYEARQGRSQLRSFYVRDERKSHGTKEKLYQSFDVDRGAGIADSSSRVVLVDDVLTSGNSIGLAADEVLERGGVIKAIVVLVDRQAGGATTLRAKYGVPVIAIYRMDEDGSLTYHGGEVH
jgi:orotate phosphoribosyltransferase